MLILQLGILLDMTGVPCGTYKLSGKPDKCLLLWCIIFVSAKDVVALLPVPSNMAGS
jgi:hypothetical protein